MTKHQGRSVNPCAARHLLFGILSSFELRPSSFPRRPGITRLELIIVVLIVLVLVGVLITYLGRQRGLADEKVCANNLRRLGEAILGFHEEKKFLPAARIAPGYATWAVEIIAHLDKDSPLMQWNLANSYTAQADAPRTALVASYFCPARPRTFWESLTGKGDGQDSAPGALGDYACASGDGDPQRDWTGPNADGAIILGEVLEEVNGLIQHWRGRTRLASLTRGQSYTFLIGEKHVPLEQLGQAVAGDGSFYNGAVPASSARIGGPGHGIAPSPLAPFDINFGSCHLGICQFLKADGSVQAYANALPEDVLATLIRRD